jgi:hypothetical protein
MDCYAPTLQRLRDRLPYPVGGAANFAAIAAFPAPVMVWVVPMEETCERNQTIGATYQVRRQQLALVIRYREVSDARGEAATTDVFGVRDQLHAVLAGWQPGPAYAPYELRRGALSQFADGAVWWQDVIETYTQQAFAPAL